MGLVACIWFSSIFKVGILVTHYFRNLSVCQLLLYIVEFFDRF